MALSVEYRTCDQEVVGSSLDRARGVKTLGMFLTPMSLCSPSSTSWYRPKGGDALQLGSKGRYGLCVQGWQVKLCDPLVTHGPYLSALEVRHDEALYKSTFTLLTLLLRETADTHTHRERERERGFIDDDSEKQQTNVLRACRAA